MFYVIVCFFFLRACVVVCLCQADSAMLEKSFRWQGWECTTTTSVEKLMSFPFHALHWFDVILVTNEFARK